MRARRKPAFAGPVVLAALSAACGAREELREPRFAAIEDAMRSMGQQRAGRVETRELDTGDKATSRYRLEAGRCYTFVAIGASSVGDLALRVREPAGREVARADAESRQAAVRFCPDRSGRYEVAVRMAAGRGQYKLGVWSRSAHPKHKEHSDRRQRSRGKGSCASPIGARFGRPMQGDTRDGPRALRGSCISGNAPERVYRVQVERRSQLTADLEASFDGALYLMERCKDLRSQLACNDDARRGDRHHSRIDTSVDPGTYYLVVDGYGNEQGDYQLIVSLEALESVVKVCEDAVPLRPDRRITANTADARDYFQATCAGGAASPERVHRLDVPRRSRLRIRSRTDHDGALYVRTVCDDPTTEIACADDFRDPRHSAISTVVDPGRYYIYMDGYSGHGQTNAGTYELEAELAPQIGAGLEHADACESARMLRSGDSIELDTFNARDDLAGSCGGEGGADLVYGVETEVRARLRATVRQSALAGVMYLRAACEDDSSERACVKIPPSKPRDERAGLDAELPPGQYFLVVDGRGEDEFGTARLQVRVDGLAALQRRCAQAPELEEGTTEGSTIDAPGQLSASCAEGTDSNEAIYRLELDRESEVRIDMKSNYDGALHLRKRCLDSASEVLCNDDHGDNRHSRIDASLDAGTYYVIADGFGEHNAGDFELDVAIEAK